jgi:uncharacterized protein YodC (DUF2158 family)
MIQVGNRVRLNSGGPELFVGERNGDSLTIQWQGDSGELCSDTLPAACCHLT